MRLVHREVWCFVHRILRLPPRLVLAGLALLPVVARVSQSDETAASAYRCLAGDLFLLCH